MSPLGGGLCVWMRTLIDEEDDDSSLTRKNDCLELNSVQQYVSFYDETMSNATFFNFFHINIRSFSKNVDDVFVYLNNNID
jgi:hypothetical protein